MPTESAALNTGLHILIPAAGTGQRFGGPAPKQYAMLCGKPIIQHSLERLLELSERLSEKCITVAVADDDDYWQELEIFKDARIKTVSGGQTRTESVQNALKTIAGAKPDDWVLIHDAVRPLIRVSDIEKLIRQLSRRTVGGLLATPICETVKRANAEGEITKTEDRNGLWIAQTPQMFRYACLVDVLAKAGSSADITDEASAIEAEGHSVKLVEGHRTNIKITRTEDLEFAELILGACRAQTVEQC